MKEEFLYVKTLPQILQVMKNYIHFFPQNHENLFSKTRHPEKYQVNMALTERYKSSSIPYMQRLLNQLDKEKHIEAT